MENHGRLAIVIVLAMLLAVTDFTSYLLSFAVDLVLAVVLVAVVWNPLRSK